MNKMAEDATRLAALIKRGKVSSSELVARSLAKIKAENQTLNAVTHLRETAALKEAENTLKTDAPFAGVPILIKGLGQSLKGEPDTASSKLLKANVATTTDNFVAGLQRAGFIILGETNAPEFGFKNVTDPELYGPTKSAWGNHEVSPGGSSGGSAAAVSADWVSLAAGNDGGGSIRIPASFSGLIGLKPTRGRVPAGPGAWRGWQGASINFGLTRSIRDTAQLLDSLQTVQPAAPFQTPLYSQGFLQTSQQPLPTEFTVGYTLESPVGTPVSKDAQHAVLDAVDFLKANGIRTVEMQNPLDGVKMMESYYIVNAGETAAMFDGIQASLGRAVTMDDMELMTWVIYQAGLLTRAQDYSHAFELWDAASYQMDQLYSQIDLFLTPTTATTAPRLDYELVGPEVTEQMRHVTDLNRQERLDLIYRFFERSLALSPFTQQANLTGQPAISLPTGMATNGLPLGIQFLARKGDEATLLQMGRLFEMNGMFKMLHETEQ